MEEEKRTAENAVQSAENAVPETAPETAAPESVQENTASETAAPESESGSTVSENAGPAEDTAAETPPADEEAPEIKTDVNVGDLESKIAEATVVGAVPSAAERPERETVSSGERTEPTPEARKKKHKKTAIIVTLVLLLLLVGTVGGVYLYMANYFDTHFYSGTIINGKDVSGQTVNDVKDWIKSNIAKYSLTITERDGVTETLSSEDVGWSYVDDKKVDQIMQAQDHWKWFLAITKSKKFDFTAGTTWDKGTAEASIDKLDCLQEANITHPVNALLNETSDGASITPEVVGNEIDKTKLIEQVEAALDAGETECSIVDPDCYVYPNVYSTDENLNSRMNQWNAYLNLEITYAFGDNTETVGKSTIAPCLTDDGTNVTISTDWIRPLVGTWADKYNTFGKDRTFKTHSGTTVTLPGHTIDQTSTDPSTGTKPNNHTSDYGWCLDSDSTAADLKSAIDSMSSGARNPVFYTWGTAKGWDNGGLTGTYVEVSLTAQHLWVYKDYQEVVSTDIVTGLPTEERATYPGCFAIDAKKSPATLGTLDMQGYSQPVNWWCPFDGGRGLHDAYWRDAFGGTIYQSNGSHGCVNIPEDVMQSIYDTVSIGTAVCVY